MFRFSDLTAELGTVKTVLRGQEVTLHGLSGAEVQMVRDCYSRPTIPFGQNPAKPNEFMANDQDPEYRTKLEMWLYRRMVLEVMVSIRAVASSGLPCPQGQAVTKDGFRPWADSVFSEANGRLSPAEVERLHSLLHGIAQTEATQKRAEGNSSAQP